MTIFKRIKKAFERAEKKWKKAPEIYKVATILWACTLGYAALAGLTIAKVAAKEVQISTEELVIMAWVFTTFALLGLAVSFDLISRLSMQIHELKELEEKGEKVANDS